ncbi:UNVERIFIED_CONTAM: hypothetical protein GTU68_015667 [Idotea baltica]|nr:hypothetical protein [Idotea baltica]
MDVILLKNIDRLGDKHDVITVKNGYGRNYLIPQGMALIANRTNKAKLDNLKKIEDAERARRKDEFQAIADMLKDKVLKIGAKSGTSGKIFGSVTNIQIAQALKEQFEVEVERKRVMIEEEVKELGTYVAQLDLHPEVKAPVTFEVIKE